MPPVISRWPPALRFFAAQLLAFGLLWALARWGLRLPGWGWVGLQGFTAALIGSGLRLSRGWIPVNLVVPLALDLVLRGNLPGWIAPGVFLALLVVFGGGLLTRVPLYHSNRDAWARMLELLPDQKSVRFVDLGAGFGGLLAHLAKARPDGDFVGVEASPLSWAVAALRCLPRPKAHVRLGSLWRTPLGDADLVFAFLSPVPMAELWAKVQREMRPGTLFVSHTFEVPSVAPDREIPLKGRKDAVLRVYVIRPEPRAVTDEAADS